MSVQRAGIIVDAQRSLVGAGCLGHVCCAVLLPAPGGFIHRNSDIDAALPIRLDTVVGTSSGELVMLEAVPPAEGGAAAAAPAALDPDAEGMDKVDGASALLLPSTLRVKEGMVRRDAHNGEAITLLLHVPQLGLLYSAGADGIIQKWNALTMQCMNTCEAHRGPIVALSWAGNDAASGELISCAAAPDKTVRRWTLRSGAMRGIAAFPHAEPTAMLVVTPGQAPLLSAARRSGGGGGGGGEGFAVVGTASGRISAVAMDEANPDAIGREWCVWVAESGHFASIAALAIAAPPREVSGGDDGDAGASGRKLLGRLISVSVDGSVRWWELPMLAKGSVGDCPFPAENGKLDKQTQKQQAKHLRQIRAVCLGVLLATPHPPRSPHAESDNGSPTRHFELPFGAPWPPSRVLALHSDSGGTLLAAFKDGSIRTFGAPRRRRRAIGGDSGTHLSHGRATGLAGGGTWGGARALGAAVEEDREGCASDAPPPFVDGGASYGCCTASSTGDGDCAGAATAAAATDDGGGGGALAPLLHPQLPVVIALRPCPRAVCSPGANFSGSACAPAGTGLGPKMVGGLAWPPETEMVAVTATGTVHVWWPREADEFSPTFAPSLRKAARRAGLRRAARAACAAACAAAAALGAAACAEKAAVALGGALAEVLQRKRAAAEAAATAAAAAIGGAERAARVSLLAEGIALLTARKAAVAAKAAAAVAAAAALAAMAAANTAEVTAAPEVAPIVNSVAERRAADRAAQRSARTGGGFRLQRNQAKGAASASAVARGRGNSVHKSGGGSSSRGRGTQMSTSRGRGSRRVVPSS